MDKDLKKQAKLKLLKELRGEMSDMMADGVGELKKVTVAAPDQEGLEEGLEKAKELTEHMPELGAEKELEEDMEEDMDMEEESMDEEEDMDKEELQAYIEELKQKLATME